MSEQPICQKTDARLLGTAPYMHDPESMAHSEIKSILKSDFADFLKTPTIPHLQCVVALLLTYQDSVLAGVRRDSVPPPRLG